jgi:hypothetical protein
MSRIAKKYSVLLVLSLFAAAMAGCGSGNREGTSAATGSPLFGGVATVGDTACNQCHSSVREALTQEFLIDQYQLSSPHHVDGLGCESCHGGGAMHNGVGPIPFVLAGFTPAQKAQRCETCHDGVQVLTVNGVPTVAPASNSSDFAASNHATGRTFTNGLCIRCHTSEGAVVSNKSGFTGGGAVLDNPAFGPPFVTTALTNIKCETCHQHGGGLRAIQSRDGSGNIVAWDPNANGRVDQFDLCTSCHTINNFNGTQLLVDGSTLTGGIVTGSVVARHTGEWYRILASTHFDNPNTGPTLTPNVIEGYNLRRTGNTPCYDCHGHEAKTETNPASTTITIHKEWAQSGHAGELLTAKNTATAGLPTGAAAVAAAMNAGATGSSWNNRDWDAASNGSCQVCHTSTGNSNYLTSQNASATGYDPANNNFAHLSGGQNELLYCWGCHSNAGTGSLRNTTQAVLTFTFQDQPIVITGKGKSTACIVCHGGRGSITDAVISDDRNSRFQGHHAPTAGIMFNEQTHLAFEFPGQNYANTTFVHDEIGGGVNGSGPCASCHMPGESQGKSHTFDAVLFDNGGVVTTIRNQALCNTCHATGGLTAPIAPASLVSLKTGYAQTSTILNNYVNNVAGFPNYLGFAINSANFNNQIAAQPVGNNDYGAFQNAKLNGEEPCAYVHNGPYTKRLLFDSIDWMDNGVLNGSITIDATTFPAAAAWYGASAGTSGAFTAARP